MKPIAVTFAAGALLLAAIPLTAQAASPSVGPSPSAAQGLPPATMQQQTGRSPGQLSGQATSPSNPSALDTIPPATSGNVTSTPGGLSPRASGAERPGG